MRVQPIIFPSVSNIGKLKANNINIPLQGNIGYSYNQLSNAYYYPVNFYGHQQRTYGSDKVKLKEKSGDFKVSYFSNVTCPACGKKMINRSMMKSIAEDILNLPPEEYLDYIGRYKDYMRPVEASVYDEIYEMSQKPGSTKDIRELVVALRNEKLPVLQQVQMRQIKKMRSLAKTLPKDEREVLIKKLDGLSKIVRKNKSDSPFRRKILVDRMTKMKIKNPRKYEKLQILASGFPTSKDMNSAWIVKYSGNKKNETPWTSQEIALRFLSPSLANTDHILAYGIDEHHDDISNYMSMHCYCNVAKGNKSFLQWLNEDKVNRIKYMQQYFADVDNLISSKRLKKRKYHNYVALATQTIEEVSRGQITSEELFSHKKSDNTADNGSDIDIYTDTDDDND